jgi:arabinofuranosyltransferase
MNKASPIKLIILISAIFYLAFILGTSFLIDQERYFTLVDDAMISMRYAKHLAQGHGLVWNIGEAPVEGFTNFGWVLYLAILHLFPFAASKISLAIMLTSLVILLANILVVYKISETLLPESKYAPLLAAIITAFYFPLVFWSLRGMEVGLLTLLINLALLLALKQENQFLISLVLMLAILVRMDAAISAMLIALYFLLKRKSFVPALAVILTVGAVLLFQKYYFGDFLPTTYYQKVTGYTVFERMRTGILVFNEFAARDVLTLFLLSIAALAFYKQRSLETFLLLGIFLGQCAYSVYVGGDYAEPETNAANRFITQGMPALFILFSWMTSRVLSDLSAAQPQWSVSNSRINPAIPLAIMVLLIISGEPWFNYTIDNAPLLKADIRRVKLALHIKENTSSEAVIAVHAAGQIPYYAERNTIDLLGLNDPIVARGQGEGEFYPGHNKWNYYYSINELQPDLIADNFAPLGIFMRDNEQYELLESDIYIRKDSQWIDIQGLSEKNYR